jgi:enamine deaminase RidA (YjgF/YER057c/UK114 family)
MRKTIFSWLGREFISFSGEARVTGSVAEQTHDLFGRFEEELEESRLSLDHTVRTRIWASDREARDLATGARSNILTGKRKAASSSYVSASHFDSGAKVALDLLAMRPSGAGHDRIAVEFEPARPYIAQLRYDSVAFVSGFTSERDRLEDQVPEVFADIDGALKAASTTWNQVGKVSVYLSRTQSVDALKNLLQKANGLDPDKIEFEFVDGFAREKGLLEIEATALIVG